MLLTFLFLFALIYVFDRKRDDLDAFSIATAAVVPTIVVFLFRMAAGFLEFGVWASFAELGLLVVATYLVLNLNLEFSAGRSAAYTAAVLVFDIVAGLGAQLLSSVI